MDERYTLEVTESQLHLISKALEFYSRIHMGQFEEILSSFTRVWVKERWGMRYQAARQALDLAKLLITENPPNQYWGIYSDQVDPEGKTAYNLHRDIRHRLAWDRDPDGGVYVDFDGPSIGYAGEDHTPAVVSKKPEEG